MYLCERESNIECLPFMRQNTSSAQISLRVLILFVVCEKCHTKDLVSDSTMCVTVLSYICVI